MQDLSADTVLYIIYDMFTHLQQKPFIAAHQKTVAAVKDWKS